MKDLLVKVVGRLIDDVLKVCHMQKLSDYLLTVDFEKAFDSLNHNFLIAVLKKYGFGDDFIDWIIILFNSQESCVINGGHSTKYFPLERGARQGDPISAYLFALVIFFILIKTNNDIQGIEIFNHEFLYTAYADDTTFVVKDLNSVKVILSSLNQFYTFSGLRPNQSKCEIAGIGVLKDANVALCGLKSVNLTKERIKILGVHLSYNEKLQNELNFCTAIKNICNVIKLWRMRHLSLEGKITIFNSLAISKIVYLALLTIVPKNVIFELKEIQNKFLWSSKKSNLSSWKLTLLNDNVNCQNIEYLSHHLIKNTQILALEKLIPKELYSLSIFLKTEIPTSPRYFIRLFPNLQCDWKDIYLLPRKVTIDRVGYRQRKNEILKLQ